MSCDNFENICIFCQDIDVKNDDNSMNMIETSEHNQNELIDYKHCLNIKVHPKCLCIWFIKQENECLICRKKLDVSHNVLNDVNVFIVNIQKDDFSVIDIIYPYKHLSAEYRRANINELPPSDIGDDIRHIEVHNIMNVDEIDVESWFDAPSSDSDSGMDLETVGRSEGGRSQESADEYDVESWFEAVHEDNVEDKHDGRPGTAGVPGVPTRLPTPLGDDAHHLDHACACDDIGNGFGDCGDYPAYATGAPTVSNNAGECLHD